MSTFLSKYRSDIFFPLKAIDMFLKTSTPPYDMNKVAELLHISEKELKTIMNEKGITLITPEAFSLIMKNGSGELCRAFRRELECGLTDTYSPEQVSYIYSLDIDDVLNAYASMGIFRLDKGLLETLFSRIVIN